MKTYEQLNRSGSVSRFVIVGLTAVAFVVDVVTPEDVAAWVLYVVPLFLVARETKRLNPLNFAAICTGLTVLGRILSPDHEFAKLAIINRALTVAVLWIVAVVLVRRQQAETALREAEARLRLSVAIADIGLWDWDLVTNQVYFSPEWKRQIGFAEEEIPNRLEEWGRHLHPDDRELAHEKIRAFLAGRGKSLEMEMRLLHKDGTCRWMLSRAQVFRDATGKPVRLLGCRIDITERMRAAEIMAESREKLRALLARLQHSREQERIRVSGEIHDELGQLLTSIKMDMLWLERKLSAPEVPPAFGALLDRAVGASELADTAIAAVQRIATNLRPVALNHLGLASAVRQEVLRLQERAGLACSVAVAEPWETLPPGISGELFYICREALTNVVRHAQAERIDVSLRQEDGAAVLEVADDGVGMDEKELGSPRSLGLTGMQERALRYGGTVLFERNGLRGTRVMARLPIRKAHEQ